MNFRLLRRFDLIILCGILYIVVLMLYNVVCIASRSISNGLFCSVHFDMYTVDTYILDKFYVCGSVHLGNICFYLIPTGCTNICFISFLKYF
jgi:hypothetical protein